MSDITYKDLSARGPLETCRELCDALMQLQAQRAEKHKDILASMNFENRLKPSFEAAEQRFLCVVYDGDRPVGYIFCDAGTVTREIMAERPAWAAVMPDGTSGFYPDSLPAPVPVSHLNNLYVLPEYRDRHIGRALMEKGMAWLRGVPGVRYIFVHVSNGNNAGTLYERYGFRYSHSVFDGMIDAYMLEL